MCRQGLGSSGAGPGTQYWLEGRLQPLPIPLLSVIVRRAVWWGGEGVGGRGGGRVACSNHE